MDINKRPWPLAIVCGIKSRIDTNPDFQRPAVWGVGQKQLLIDSILRGYDVPKFYWRMIGKNPDKYDVIDGQQRLRAVWEFREGNIALPKDSEPIDGIPIHKQRYEDPHDDLRMRFDTYPIDVIIVSDTDDDEVREMFLRLQNGTSLKAQEKRTAMPCSSSRAKAVACVNAVKLLGNAPSSPDQQRPMSGYGVTKRFSIGHRSMMLWTSRSFARLLWRRATS